MGEVQSANFQGCHRRTFQQNSTNLRDCHWRRKQYLRLYSVISM